MLIDGDRLGLGRRGWISDTATGASVSSDGTIDWYCPGRFDSPAALFRMIDPARGSAVRIGPAGAPRLSRRAWASTQRYQPGSNVLTTTLDGRESTIRVTDVMPWDGTSDRPAGRLIRLVEGLRGLADIEVEVIAGQAWKHPGKVSAWSEGIAFGDLTLRSGLEMRPIAHSHDQALWRGATTLEPGELTVVSVDRTDEAAGGPVSVDSAMAMVARTTSAWRSWLSQCSYDGPYRSAVERSALGIKALCWYRTGVPVSAGTMGLPRVAGGQRNYDRRHVWLRDACDAAATMRRLGLVDDAEAMETWLRSLLADTAVPLPSVTDLEGGPVSEAVELKLAGWRRSEPVTSGVVAASAPDLDLLGVMAAVVRPGNAVAAAWSGVVAVADWACDNWRVPDSGVWGLAGLPRQLVASKIEAWSGLAHLARVARARNPFDLDATGWQQSAKEILDWLETEAVDDRNVLCRSPAEISEPDAALLRTAWSGPWPADHPIVRATVDSVVEQLSDGLLLRRYPAGTDDGIEGSDSPDLVASLWAVRALCRVGRWEEAHARMDAVCRLAEPLGIMAETADPLAEQLTGNLPSTPVHLALIEAANALGAGPR